LQLCIGDFVALLEDFQAHNRGGLRKSHNSVTPPSDTWR
jgi:hypothetical protein